ncbi:hypothetical protein LCGC14_1073220 [marine sediment metagenome]|uniref:Uncharacterized protein n=1 Tax=marine sediment metagenome TaxID=412755 RepID=A0A0F9N4X2_9ZZZZ
MAHEKDEAVLRIAERQRWREDDARVVVEAWRRSGESLSHFAGRHRLRRERIGRWASRIEKPDTGGNGMRFHRVRLVEAQDRWHQGGEKIEVVLPDGRLVRVPHGFAPEELQQVLRVLALEEGA